MVRFVYGTSARKAGRCTLARKPIRDVLAGLPNGPHLEQPHSRDARPAAVSLLRLCSYGAES